MTSRRPWTDVELSMLREEFAGSRTDDLSRALNRPYSSVAQKAAALGLRKSAEYLASPAAHRFDGVKGMGTRIQPGAVPWNKGKSYTPGGRCAEGQFKPGRPASAAHNYVPIDSQRVCRDGLLERKVTDDPSIVPARRWVAVHRLVWSEANGPIPEGHAVVFKPGHRTAIEAEITLDKLELVTRRELMLRNTLHRYPPEISRLVQLRGALVRQINRKAKDAG